MSAEIIPFPRSAAPFAITINQHRIKTREEWVKAVLDQRSSAEREVANFKKLGELVDRIVAQSGREAAAEFIRATAQAREITLCTRTLAPATTAVEE